MTKDTDPNAGDDVRELALELNFVPDWAKDHAPTVHIEARQREGGPKSPREGRRQGRDRNDRGRNRTTRGGHGGSHQRQDRRGPPPIRRAPVRVDFIPDRQRLGKVVHLIRHSKRAYDIQELAHRFMTSPSLFAVKLTLHHRAMEEGEHLYQYRPTGQVFMKRDECVAHALRAGMERFFEPVETEVDPPTGNFPCVARCRLGGELLGPPNHHSYAAALERLRNETYPRMRVEELKSRVEMVHDPEIVEAWRNSQTKSVAWRAKDASPEAEQEEAPLRTTREAESWLRERLQEDVQEAARAICAGTVAVHGDDVRMVRAVETAAMAEQNEPKSMMRALRPALKHMRLTFFSAGGRRFVTGVPPEPLHGRAVPEIEKTLEYLKDHPGAQRAALIEFLSPGKTEKDDEVVHELSSLRWLIDKGHVIEFFDGSLALPAEGR